jgi:tetratricopeptide (TPR) repeat protein
MGDKRIFVGRESELDEFGKVLEDPQGQAVLVVGQAGMGKSVLVSEMASRAEKDQLGKKGANLKCWSVHYRVTPTDPVDSIMERIIVEATEAASPIREKLGMTGANKEKWRVLFGAGELVPIFGKKMSTLGNLLLSWRQTKTGDIRTRFVKALEKLSNCMYDKQRAIFIIDPEKCLQEKSDYSWGLVVDQLPDKVKFVFPQRPDDVIAKGEGFDGLSNVLRIPEGQLGPFEKENVEELLSRRSAETPELTSQLRDGAMRSDRRPYSVEGTLELIALARMGLKELAKYLRQDDVARAQWRSICDRGDEAVRLFKAYAILEIAVPDDVVEAVSGLESSNLRKLLKDKYLIRLLSEEESRRIYHAILADYVLGQTGEDEKKEYHGRALEVYRGKLREAREKQTKPDELAARRLCEHVLEAKGKMAFVDAFVNECFEALDTLGLLDTSIGLSERALGYVDKGSKEEANVLGNLGLVYRTMGNLDRAEQMHKESLKIAEELGRQELVAGQYGNLGIVYMIRGELVEAEEMYLKSLGISEQAGMMGLTANQYCNLGLSYRMRGRLKAAEEMLCRSLAIWEKLGDLANMANSYGNLALVYRDRGELEKTEGILHKALGLFERLGDPMGVANQHGNLGVVYWVRGDLQASVEHLQKALEIDEKTGNLYGVARHYTNLGLVYRDSAEWGKAEAMSQKALEIARELGNQETIASVLCNLGSIYVQLGKGNRAEQLFHESIAIAEGMGWQRGMAESQGNLGSLYMNQGKLHKAEEMYKKVIDIAMDLGDSDLTAHTYANLGLIEKKRAEHKNATEYWEKALEMYKKIGMPHMVEKVQGWIDGLGKD